jgi:hypothetical protein
MKLDWMLDDEWTDWYRLTPAERWRETDRLWSFYLEAGGSLDPEPDSQSPFNAFFPQRARTSDGRTSLRGIRRS